MNLCAQMYNPSKSIYLAYHFSLAEKCEAISYKLQMRSVLRNVKINIRLHNTVTDKIFYISHYL